MRIQFQQKTVLITGASSGIGKALAKQLAARGADLIVVARSRDRLEALAAELRASYQIQVTVFAVDLSVLHSAQALYQATQQAGLQVDYLINNAGFGRWTAFLDEPLAGYQQMLQLNIQTLVELTYWYVPQMVARGQGGVMNIASTAAFQPLPYIAVYGASKGFVLQFTEALAGEYADQGIACVAVCAGNTQTDFVRVANADTTGMSASSPEEVAQVALAAWQAKRISVVVGWRNWLSSLLPRLLSRAMVVALVRRMLKTRVLRQA